MNETLYQFVNNPAPPRRARAAILVVDGDFGLAGYTIDELTSLLNTSVTLRQSPVATYGVIFQGPQHRQGRYVRELRFSLGDRSAPLLEFPDHDDLEANLVRPMSESLCNYACSARSPTSFPSSSPDSSYPTHAPTTANPTESPLIPLPSTVLPPVSVPGAPPSLSPTTSPTDRN